MIYHITTLADWQRQATESTYEADSLLPEGFIHMSEKQQVAGVLERYYQGVPNLLLLHIDPARLTAELKYEASTDHELFPHLYGPLNKDAVVEVEQIN